jgi:hypothetical protein
LANSDAALPTTTTSVLMRWATQTWRSDRRNPPSEFIIEQFRQAPEAFEGAPHRRGPPVAHGYPRKLAGADPKAAEQAFTAFRKVLKDKS